MNFLRDTRHLWILLLLLASAGWGMLSARNQLVPKSFGERGPYRAAALSELAAKPSVFQSDSVCHECHQNVQHEREQSLHKVVRCVHCHGYANEHVEQARRAAKIPESKIPPPSQWDGNFSTQLDLFITKDRKICLVCHESVIGMPKNFKQINVAKHLEETGASEPTSRESCFECHGGHDTAP